MPIKPPPPSGSPLAKLATIIVNDVQWLNTAWTVSGYLISHGPRRRAAFSGDFVGRFFGIAYPAIAQQVYLGVAKLLDPAKTGSHENATLAKWVEMLDAGPERDRIAATLATLDSSKGIRFIRNKRLAHHDYQTRLSGNSAGVSNDEMSEAIEGVATLTNELLVAGGMSPQSFEDRSLMHDVADLQIFVERGREWGESHPSEFLAAREDVERNR